jgi:hypothetical protein
LLFYFFVNYLVIFYFILVAPFFFIIFLKGKKKCKKITQKKKVDRYLLKTYTWWFFWKTCPLVFTFYIKKHINITLNIHVVVVFIRDNGIWIPIHVLNYKNQTIFILPKRYYNNLIIIFERNHLKLYSTGLSSSNSREIIGTLDL